MLPELNLHLKRKSENEIVLRHSYFFRALCLFFSVSILIGVIAYGAVTPLAIIFIVGSALGGFYTEEWKFRSDDQNVEYKIGFLFAFKRKIIPFSTIRNFNIEKFVRGKSGTSSEDSFSVFQKEYLRFSLTTEQEEILVIDSVSTRKKRNAEGEAEAIASFCDKELFRD